MLLGRDQHGRATHIPPAAGPSTLGACVRKPAQRHRRGHKHGTRLRRRRWARRPTGCAARDQSHTHTLTRTRAHSHTCPRSAAMVVRICDTVVARASAAKPRGGTPYCCSSQCEDCFAVVHTTYSVTAPYGPVLFGSALVCLLGWWRRPIGRALCLRATIPHDTNVWMAGNRGRWWPRQPAEPRNLLRPATTTGEFSAALAHSSTMGVPLTRLRGLLPKPPMLWASVLRMAPPRVWWVCAPLRGRLHANLHVLATGRAACRRCPFAASMAARGTQIRVACNHIAEAQGHPRRHTNAQLTPVRGGGW